MDDALVGVVQVEEPYAKLMTIVAERVNLLLGDGIGDRQASIGRGDVVIGRGKRGRRLSHTATGYSQAFKGLGTCHLVHQMAINVENWLLACGGADQMAVPNLFQQRAGCGGHVSKTFVCGVAGNNLTTVASQPLVFHRRAADACGGPTSASPILRTRDLTGPLEEGFRCQFIDPGFNDGQPGRGAKRGISSFDEHRCAHRDDPLDEKPTAFNVARVIVG